MDPIRLLQYSEIMEKILDYKCFVKVLMVETMQRAESGEQVEFVEVGRMK